MLAFIARQLDVKLCSNIANTSSPPARSTKACLDNGWGAIVNLSCSVANFMSTLPWFPLPPLGKTSNLLDTGSISHSHPPHVVCPTEGVIVSLSLRANFMSTSPSTSFLVCFAYYADGIHEVLNIDQSVRISRGAKKYLGVKNLNKLVRLG